MSDWFDNQAEESEHDDEEMPAKKKVRIESDEEEEEEEEDDSAIAEEMKDFVVIGDEEEEQGEETGEEEKKSETEEEADSDLEEDEEELLKENLGISLKKKVRRVAIGSDSEGSEQEEQDAQRRLERELFEGDDDAEASRPVEKELQTYEREEPSSSAEESELDDFIEDDEEGLRQKKGRPKQRHRNIFVSDSVLEEARDIFGVDIDFDEFIGDNEQEVEAEEDDEVEYEETGDEVEEAKRVRVIRKKAAKKQMLLEVRYTPVTEADADEIAQESSWIYEQAFRTPTLSAQEELDSKPLSTVDKIKEALNFMRNQNFEVLCAAARFILIHPFVLQVPFIAFYRKEYVEPELSINDLWKIFQFDEQVRIFFCVECIELYFWLYHSLIPQNRVFLASSVFNYIEIMNKNAAHKLRVKMVNCVEDLEDADSYFYMYNWRYVPAMREFEMAKRAEAKEDDKEKNEEMKTIQKQPLSRDKYTLCVDAGKLVAKFGLTPKQFAENLEVSYCRHEVDQYPEEPLVAAKDYICPLFPTPEEVLIGAKYMAAMELSHTLLTRRIVRSECRRRATITVRPTKKGRKEIDENHMVYTKKYLKCKPVGEVEKDEYLRLLQVSRVINCRCYRSHAEDNGLLKVTISVDGATTHGGDYLAELKNRQLYYRDEYSKNVQEWNRLRNEVLEKCMRDMLFPHFAGEIRNRLMRESVEYVARVRQCKFFSYINVFRHVL
ncbi:unnamed protein product [Soboliphyme baturini]|uniref:Transcription elongation factor SPT6 n=1 Tax=Soboliphyme baturini TaxID=241478 RepID=A0A183IPK4_9BILA|nr:unnamed protein product [Soboliphyme baturini]